MNGKEIDMSNTVDLEEVKKFSHTKEEWWDPEGKFKTLHVTNHVRLKYIRQNIKKFFGIKDPMQPLKGRRVLDIGCGGGLLAEPVARMGAKLTAVDVSKDNIASAKEHAADENLEIDYRCISIEELAAKESKKFDVILCLEVVEHVKDLPLFIESCANLLKKDGLLVVSTMNKTIKSYLLAIVGAEYILNWLPVGTHSWDKFVRPSELEAILRDNKIYLRDMSGMEYAPFSAKKWRLCQNTDVNYFACGLKSSS